jgi:hypothetical protein
MFISKKNNHIIAFSELREELAINAEIKGITLDSMEETKEQIVPSYNTPNDGVYYKISEVPEEPPDSFNARQRVLREARYGEESDPITSHIAVIRDRIAGGEYASDEKKESWEDTVAELLAQRRDVRQRIADDFPYKTVEN